MNSFTEFIFELIGTSILLLIPAVLIQLYLIKEGVIRNNLGLIVFGMFVAVLIKRVWFNEISWVCFGPLIIIGGILSMNRGDLWQTMQKGRWWWKLD